MDLQVAMDGDEEMEEMEAGGGEQKVKAVVLMDDTDDEEEEEEEAGSLSPGERQDRKAAREKKRARLAARAPCPIFCPRHKIIHTVEYGEEAVLHEYDNIDVRGAAIVEGFPTEGLTAIMTVQTFIDELKLPLIGEIVFPGLMPLCVVKENLPSSSCRIYGDRRIVAFLSERKNLSGNACNAIVTAIFDFAKRHHCQNLFTLEGVPEGISINAQNATAEKIMAKLKEKAASTKVSPMRFLTNSPEFGDKLKTMGHKPIRGAMIWGVTGGILARATSSSLSVNVTGLLSPYNPMLSDARATIALVRTIVELLGDTIQIDVTPLQEKADDMEKKVKKAINQAASANSSRHPSMYL